MSRREKDADDTRSVKEIIDDCKKLHSYAKVGLRNLSGSDEEEDHLRLSIVFVYAGAIFSTFNDRLKRKCGESKYDAWRLEFQFQEWKSLPEDKNRLATFISRCTTVRNDIMHGSLLVYGPKDVKIAVGTGIHNSEGNVVDRKLRLLRGPLEYKEMEVSIICENLLGRLNEYLQGAELNLI
jgi:hypothetical protein